MTWQKATRDPDDSVAWFIIDGAPLGMATQIPMSNGVFPTVDEEDMDSEDPELELEVVKHWRNFLTEEKYRPVIEQELRRVGEEGKCQKLPWEEAEREFGVTTVSRVGLIEKDRPDGRKLQALTLDVEDAGGNLRAQVQERVVLPKGVDVIRSLRKAAMGWGSVDYWIP